VLGPTLGSSVRTERNEQIRRIIQFTEREDVFQNHVFQPIVVATLTPEIFFFSIEKTNLFSE
jgi:hypothetical protein